MRGRFLFLIVVSVFAGWVAAWSQSAVSPANGIARLSAVAAHADGESVTVEISLTTPVEPQVSTVENPARLVLDFSGCKLAHSIDRVVLNRGSVRAVRVSDFSANPPTARVVVDLTSAVSHREAYSGNKLIIKLEGSESSVAVAANPPMNVAANAAPTNPAPVSRSGSDSTAAVDTAKTAVSTVAESAAVGSMPPEGSATKDLTPPQNSLPKALNAYALIENARHLDISDLESLETRAKAGDVESETTLALAYHSGTLLKMNDAEALRLLQDAANRGFVAAEEALGIFYQNGIAVPADKSKAVYWYTRASKDGSVDAETNLALMYSTGDGVAKDYTEAWILFRSAATAGDATAQLNLAALYHRGEGVTKDDQQAATWLRRAAEQGSVRAMLEFADWEMQAEHGGDMETAIVWFKKAAEQGDASAQAILGDIYVQQKFGRQNYAEAVKWYTMAAQQGQREAEFGLGTRYLLGQGVDQDLALARRWLTPAADRGHPYAQLLLAKMFESGQGGPADTVAATKYYSLSADAGLAEAQYRLALMLSANETQAQANQDHANLVLAYKWLVLSEDGVKESTPRAEELRKSLSTAEIASAEHQIDEWRIAHLPREAKK